MTNPAGRDAYATRLIRRPSPTSAQREWDGEARQLLDSAPDAGGWLPWQVLGGPGTGKTALLTDFAVGRIADGTDPESVLLLTHSRSAADAARAAITAGLLGRDGVGVRNATREPLVRTVHSYAFAVLRLQAAAHGNPPPRLMTGAEQDTVIREMLLGDIEDGPDMWPERLRPALALGGFASELRDLLLRASERGLGPEDLVKLGRKRHRPEWVAAGKFATGLEQSTLLRFAVGVEAPEASAPALDAAELVGAALSAFAADRELLARERKRIRYLLVDDAQHLDPQAAQLVRLIGTGTSAAVVAGDPDQGVFAFRGADSAFLKDLADDAPARRGEVVTSRRVVLATNYRAAGRLALVATRTAARLPGRQPHRGAVAMPDAEPGQVRVEVAATVAKEAALIADHLRRAHLYDGVPWSEMAVLMRSVPLSLAPLRRALAAAGVPTNTPVSDLPLARQRGAAWLLQVLRAIGASEFTPDDALALLSGPVGGADPVALRRLRRGVRRIVAEAGRDEDSAEVLRRVIADAADEKKVLAALTDVEAAPLRRVLKVLARARAVRRMGRGVEDVLWAAWQASGLERGWTGASARGGALGAQADRDLDSVVALFDAAAAYVDRLPRAGIEGFVDYLERQQIPGGPGRSGAADPEAVALLSAHAAVGREWTVVAVAGVQEGLWPGLRARGTLLGTGDLVDLAAGT
ncbi:ATP-dependent helicase, partial [Aldersonia kunmingensis]|uniref:ATP-dependent helicase n=1 Tax=Aldersonia kunmingensis TaxID=408066 RepID=UPI0012ECFF62